MDSQYAYIPQLVTGNIIIGHININAQHANTPGWEI